jgi:hypothetical protein
MSELLRRDERHPASSLAEIQCFKERFSFFLYRRPVLCLESFGVFKKQIVRLRIKKAITLSFLKERVILRMNLRMRRPQKTFRENSLKVCGGGGYFSKVELRVLTPLGLFNF